MTKAELAKYAEQYFKEQPKRKEILATSDGNFFWPEQKNAALDHKVKNNLELHTITKKVPAHKAKQVEVSQDKAEKNVADVVQAVADQKEEKPAEQGEAEKKPTANKTKK